MIYNKLWHDISFFISDELVQSDDPKQFLLIRIESEKLMIE